MPVRRSRRGRLRRFRRQGVSAPSKVTKVGVKSAVRKYKTKVFNNRVKNAMRQLVEAKDVSVRGAFTIVPFNTGNANTCDTTNIISFDPVINQGTGHAQRIGNVIQMVNCRMSFIITCQPSVSSLIAPQPTVVKLIFFYDREDTNSLPTPYQNGNFYDNNNAAQQFTGRLPDLFYKINTDRYRILGQRSYKLGFAANSGTNASPTYQNFTNNDSKMFIRGSVDCTKWIIKHQKFNDNLGTAMTRKLYCLVMSINQSGLIGVPANPMNAIDWEIKYDYTDA